VHALVDERATHVLEEMAREVDRLSVGLGRPLTLIAESDLNDPRMVTPRVAGGTGIHAQWSDDFHHALHTALTGEGQGYYRDFADAGLGALAKTLTGAFFHDDAWSGFRRRHHGRPVDTARLPGWKFLGYLQDHDQIGNRAIGDRVSASLSPGLLAVGATLVLTSPFTPMLFMGEEWGAATPWQFFTSHTDPEIGRATAEGRKGEFAEHGWDADEVPDPQDPETFTRSKLDWAELDKEPHARLLAVHKALLALRRQHPDLVDADLSAVRVERDDAERWMVVHRGSLRVVVNLSGEAREVLLDAAPASLLFSTGELPGTDGRTVTLEPESAVVLSTR
jgi:maltooligosyltrehalose trehalohydrolase